MSWDVLERAEPIDLGLGAGPFGATPVYDMIRDEPPQSSTGTWGLASIIHRGK
jgi:hypothetical protein